MAAATVTALAGLGMSGYQAYQGHQNAKKANQAINNYDRQDLDKSNPYENMPISTVGSDIMREESQRNNANAVEALRNGGTRGIAMIPQVVAANNRQNQEARAYLDDQVTKRNYAIAGDKTAIRGMKEDRENADLAGLGQQLETGRQDMWSGFRGMANSGMYWAENYKPTENPQVDGIESFIKPIGLTPQYTKSLTPTAPTLSSMLRGFNKV